MCGSLLSRVHDQPTCNIKIEAKLLLVIGLTAEHVYRRITFILYTIRL